MGDLGYSAAAVAFPDTTGIDTAFIIGTGNCLTGPGRFAVIVVLALIPTGLFSYSAAAVGILTAAGVNAAFGAGNTLTAQIGFAFGVGTTGVKTGNWLRRWRRRWRWRWRRRWAGAGAGAGRGTDGKTQTADFFSGRFLDLRQLGRGGRSGFRGGRGGGRRLF